MINVKLTVPTNKTLGQIMSQLHSCANASTDSFLHSFASIMSGEKSGACYVELPKGDGVVGGCNILIDNTKISADDVVRVGIYTFTAKAAGAGANEFDIGADAAATAVNLAASMNAAFNTSFLRASSASGIVTVVPVLTSSIYNYIPILKTEAVADSFTLSVSAFSTASTETVSTLVVKA